MKTLIKNHYHLLSVAVVTTLLFGTVFGAGQQVLRMSANDPQVQIAEDTVRQLDNGAQPDSVTNATKVDVGSSLAPFVMIYDKAGNQLATSGQLNGKAPKIPTGVLFHTRENTDRAVTWQPASELRFASVTAAGKNYYVVSARSLREVEQRETDLAKMVLIGWIAALGALMLAYYAHRAKH